MEHYSNVCATVGMESTCNKFKLGQTSTRFFDTADLHQGKDGLEDLTYKYVGLKLRPQSDRMVTPYEVINFPTNRIAGTDNDQYIINIPTNLLLNGKAFDINFGYDMNQHTVQLLFNGKVISNVQEFSIQSVNRLDQVFADGLKKLTSKMNFGRGLCVNFNEQSTVPIMHNWKEETTEHTFDKWSSYHSKNCKYLLPFSKEYSMCICHTCIKDLK